MEHVDQSPKLLTYPEAAAQLGMSPITLRRWVSDGRIGFRKIGRRAVRFTQSDLAAVVHVHPAPVAP